MGKPYSDLKIFHFASKLKDMAKGKITTPLHVRIKPTNLCNQACYYCCYRNKRLHLNQLFNYGDMISWEKMKKIIADLKSMGVKAITFSGGGEPLLYPYIKESLVSIIKARIKIGVLTNGSLLNGERADILANGASWVRVSIDGGNRVFYANNRQVSPEEFDSLCFNIRDFAKKKNKDCKLGANFIVTRENYMYIFKSLSLLKELGVDNVKICECVVSKSFKKNEKYLMYFFKKAKNEIEKSIALLANKNFIIIDQFFNPLDNNSYQKHYRTCPFIQCMIVIGADMNVYTCQDKAYTNAGKLFSIRNRSFTDGWFSLENIKKIENIDPSKECIHHCTQHHKNLMLLEFLDTDKSHLEFV